MNPFVVYYSKTGNTMKIARTIAEALDTEAHDVKDVKSVPKGAFLVVGSGVYAGKAGKPIMDFLNGIPETKDGKAAVFETSGDGEKSVAGEQMKWVLDKKRYDVMGGFVCPGQLFKLFRRGYPRPEDFDNARKFASELKNK